MRYGVTLVLAAAVLAIAMPSGTSAATETSRPEEAGRHAPHFDGVVSIAQGSWVDLPVAGLTRFAVGAPNVTAERTDSGLRLTGRQPGTTVVAVWTETGRNSYQVRITAQAARIGGADGRSPNDELPALPSVEMTLEPGQSEVLKGRDIIRTSVSNPDIVSIVPVSATEVLVNALKEGAATVRIWDARGVSTYVITVARKAPTPEEIAAAISQQIGVPSISVRVVGDTVILTGLAATADIAQKAGRIAEASGKKVVNLITVEAVSPENVVNSLKAALPAEPLTYEILPDQTVLIRGSVASSEDALRIKDVIQAWIATPEADTGGRGGLSTSTQIRFAGFREEAPADIVDKARVEARQPEVGEVVVGEEFNTARRVFGGRILNGPRIVAILDINPALAKQLLVTAQVIEVDRTKLKSLGIQWREILGEDAISPIVITEDRPEPIRLNDAGPFGRNRLESSLRALIEEEAARVLSEPKVLITDGHAANIHVGGEIPIPVAQSLTGATASISVQFKPFGIQLNVRPKITSDNRILLTVGPEVSTLDRVNAVQVAGFFIPALRTRRATTTVHMGNGESLAIGGLLSSEDVKAVDRIPLLSKIPIIGELFKSRRFEKNETELVILVTPEIVERGAAVPIPAPGP